MSSIVYVPAPLAGCLMEADKLLRDKIKWFDQNNPEFRFLEYIRRDNERLIDTILRGLMISTASEDAEVLTKFFNDNGFPEFKFDPFEPFTFGTGAILKIVMEWAREGENTTMMVHVHEPDHPEYWDSFEHYPAALFKNNGETFQSPAHLYPVASLKTISDFNVFATLAPDGVTFNSEVGLFNYINGIAYSLDRIGEWKDLLIPKISLKYNHNLSGIVDSRGWVKKRNQIITLIDAKQVTKFDLDEKGAKVESAASMVFALEAASMPRYEFQFDKPFLLWITPDNDPTSVIMASYLNTDSWKEPTK